MYGCMDAVDRAKNWWKGEYSKNPVFTLFATVMALMLLVFIVVAVITGGKSVTNMFWVNRYETFSDYFDSIAYSSNNPYSIGVIYPPLITVFYAAIGHFAIPFADPSFIDPSAVASASQLLSLQLRNSQMGLMSYFVITLLTFYAVRRIVSKLSEGKSINAEALFLLLALSYPLLYTVERGNNVILAVVFCFIFLMGYKSENKIIRYLSYAALGVAAGIKIYPALFGLLILRDRKYKEMLECVIIVALIFFIPFLFTDGTPMMMVDNILDYAVPESVAGFINLTQLTFAIFQTILPHGTVVLMSNIVVLTVTLLSVIIIFFDRGMKPWKVVALIAFNIILGPGVGTQYLFVYVVIPLVYFLITENQMTRENKFFLLCFIIILALIPGIEHPGEAYSQLAISTIKSVFVIAMTVYLIVEGIRRLYREFREKRKGQMALIDIDE
jgi:Protein of unknown function (DUF2029).